MGATFDSRGRLIAFELTQQFFNEQAEAKQEMVAVIDEEMDPPTPQIGGNRSERRLQEKLDRKLNKKR